MKIIKAIVVLLAVSIVSAYGAYYALKRPEHKPVPVGQPTPPPSGPGWVDLLDASHAPQWKNVSDDKDLFEIADGALHLYGITLTPLRYVGYTGEMFSDFDLHVEYKIESGGNSGIFIHKQPGDEVKRGFEVQVQDDFGEAPTRNTSGSIYDVVTAMFNMARPAGEWNSLDITTRGKLVTIHMNGWLVVQADLGMMTTPLGKFEYAFNDLPTTGMLALQDHGGEVWYRNILIRPAAAVPAAQ